MKLLSLLCDPSPEETNDTLDYRFIHEQLVNSILYIILFLGVPIVINAVVGYFQEGWDPIYELYIAGLVVLFFILVYKKKLPLVVRSLVFMITLYAIGIAVLISFGLGGTGILMLAGFTALASGIWGARSGQIALVISLIGISTVGILVMSDIITPFQNQEVTNSATPWILALIIFTMFGLCSVKTAGALHKYLHKTIKLVIERNAKIDETNKILIEQLYELRRRQQLIKRNDEEKVVVLKELHHRVKNNLQIVQSLLVLQAKQVSDPETVTVFEESCNRIRSLAWVHEELYHTNNFAYVDVTQYMKRLVQHLQNQYHHAPIPIDINLNVHQVDLGIDKAIPCGLIINELVSNALRHAFNGKNHFTPVIDITLYEINEHIVLTVSDNGVGLPYDIDISTTESLGLQLVRVLSVDQLNGSLKITRNGGTHFTIKFNQ